MRFFLKFSLILTIILIAASVFLPAAHGVTFPRTPGPALDRYIRSDRLKEINETQPQVIIIGDSTLNLGLDPAALAAQTDKTVYSIGIPGSASALWYLVLKNTIADVEHKPDYVLIIFRDTILTAPDYRVQGSYFTQLDENAGRNEPVLIEKAFINQMNPLELAAEKYFSPYVFRTELRGRIDAGIRYLAPPLFGCDVNCTDLALGEIFEGADLEPQGLVNAVGAAESLLYTPEQLDFHAQVDKSFLPDMIEIAQANNIQLVFVRIKVESGIGNSAALDQYLADLSAYLDAQNVLLLDYGEDPRLTSDLFRDPIHLNEAGRALFTQMVADGLKEIFPR